MRLHEAHRRGELETECIALHSPGFQDFSPAGRRKDRDSFKQGLAGWYEAFPDLEVHVDDLLVDLEQQKVAIRWSAHGTHRKPFLGAQATDRLVEFRGIEIVTIINGRITERWGEWDGIALLVQLDVVPS